MAPTPSTGVATPLPALSPLHPQDPLRHQWQLQEDLAPPTPELWQQHDAAQRASARPARPGHLRLSTPAESGHPWECRVPFSELAREGGLILGTCPQAADIILPHPGISHRHALLEIAETGLVITALCPHQSTHVNEQQLGPYDRRIPLSPGTGLQLGSTNLHLEYIH